jgi:hypothetical protein
VDRKVKLDEMAAGTGYLPRRRGAQVSSSETTVIILVTVIHVVAFAVMLWIRFRRSEADHTQAETGDIRRCAVCREPAPYLVYDGLDPNAPYDPRTGRSHSADMTHYQPLCAAHASARPQVIHT